MTTDDETTAATPAEPATEVPEVPLIEVPKIDFTVPSDVPLTDVRKGFGIGDVGSTGPTAQPDPPAPAEGDE